MTEIGSLKELKDIITSFIEKDTLNEQENSKLALLIESQFVSLRPDKLEEIGIQPSDYKSLAVYFNEHFNEHKVFPSLFTSKILSLPKKRDNNEDIHTYLVNILDQYKNLIIEIEKEFDISFEISVQLDLLCTSIQDSILAYYKGSPSRAFSILTEALSKLEDENHLLLITKENLPSNLFRMRKTDGLNSSYQSGEMFHIPFNLRHLIATQRYSIPGLPCLYLGGSAYICWEELERPLLEQTQTAIVSTISNNLKVLDFGLRPSDFYEEIFSKILNRKNGHLIENEWNELKNYLIFWPLIAASSIQVNFRNAPFKPEYIIPQMILQWVTLKPDYDGIRYFSVKETAQENSLHLIHNYVIPVKSSDLKEGHCPYLKRSFAISSGVPWQLFKLQSVEITGPMGGQFKLMKDSEPIFYNLTDFGKLESYLSNKGFCEGEFIYIGRLSEVVTENREDFFIVNKEKIEILMESVLSLYKSYNSPRSKPVNWELNIENDYIEVKLKAIGRTDFIKEFDLACLHLLNEKLSQELGLPYGFRLIQYDRKY